MTLLNRYGFKVYTAKNTSFQYKRVVETNLMEMELDQLEELFAAH